ncbi:hypothetical protein EVAR_5126_1 [Eumeta japonica]|uniref:Uncharacterized protein n=1 Tax=Eumeta variegata TaxID=151549 RepID=A0A4C1SUH2_EUMVA|nr:hypothetical protein EVAR_5126_1 [Eumeta japonica]
MVSCSGKRRGYSENFRTAEAGRSRNSQARTSFIQSRRVPSVLRARHDLDVAGGNETPATFAGVCRAAASSTTVVACKYTCRGTWFTMRACRSTQACLKEEETDGNCPCHGLCKLPLE